ncbi:MAG: M23 family metallopeptidase [Sphingomonadales bacterium]|nr:M23 family metallopeptidase [Sphingomonadales bacterium]
MSAPQSDWRRIAKTIAVTAAVTSAIWIVVAAFLLQRYADFTPGRTDATPDRSVADARPRDQDVGAPGSVSPPPSSVATYKAATGDLIVPVAGVRPGDLVDTFTQARAGGARVHDAIDIMAADGTPVVAAAGGRVEKLFYSKGGGGITAYVRSPDQNWVYYYAHLRDYAPGLKEGRTIARGDPIGTVGHSGNASAEGPHLHFAIHRMEDGEGWWQGTPVNPYPLLTR